MQLRTMSQISFLPVGLCIVVLAGCAIGWSRPNTTEAEFYQDRYQCEQQAAQMYPVAMVQRTVGSGYQAPAQTNCYTYGNNTSCTTTPGTYTPPATVTEDANSVNRNVAFQSCLNSKGYTFKMEFK
jgi:hypothetical protein